MRPDVVGVVCHQSALSIHGLSDVNPARIHLTLPAALRLRRQVPMVLVIHYADLASEDVERVEGVPVTTPARCIRDAHAIHLGSEVAVTDRGQPWTSISVDVARWEAGESDVEWVDAIALTDAFGVTGPAQLPCLPLRFHVAQKLHGMTLPPRPGKQNERFRDLVDLLLIEALVPHDYPALRTACELVFGSRHTHAWPPNLDAVPPHWAAPFTQLARELELRDTDVDAALIRVRNFVGRILSAGP
jgi:hypothetical protein